MQKQSATQFSIISIIILTILGTASCKKNTKGPSTGTFYFYLHSNIDTNDVTDTTKLYTDANGRQLGLWRAEFFISGISLLNSNGTIYSFKDVCILTDLTQKEYLVGTAPEGTYTSVSFNVGLDSSKNATLPSSYPFSNPLSDTSMWFGDATKGYMFMKIRALEGVGGLTYLPFFEIGSNLNLKRVTLPIRGTGNYAPYVLTSGGTQTVHLTCDYAILLSDLYSTDTYNLNPSDAITIANNIPKSFRYQE